MEIFETSPELDNALVDPANWSQEDWVHEQFSWLRANAPLRKLAPEGFEPFWNVTRYNDIKEIEQHKDVFINDPRPVLGPQMMQAIIRISDYPDLEPIILNQAKNEIQEQYLASHKAKQLLGWEPQFSLDEALTETMAWYHQFLQAA